MDIYQDELRRQLRDLDRDHRAAMPRWRDALMRLFEDRTTPPDAKADLLLGRFNGGFGNSGPSNRRRFLRLSGGVLAAGTVLAACGDDDDDSADDDSTDTTDGEATEANKTDITVARTAASLEIFAVSVYDTAIAGAATLKISEGVTKVATLFRNQHDEHAKAFNGAATQLGGEEYTEPNPKAKESFAATIAGLKTEQDVLKFAYALEIIAAQTYQGVGAKSLSTPTLRQTAMSVGAVEARHAAVLGMFVQPPVAEPTVAFQLTDKAIDASFFV